MTDRITVSGFRPPRRRPARQQPKRVPLVQPRHLLWLVALASLPVIAAIFGTPYVLLGYRTIGEGMFRTCIEGTYVGRDTRVIHPRDGRCPYFRLIRADERN